MCLAVFALDAHPRFALIVASNRDEFHDRPSAPLHWWESGILGGRDLSAGGTWMGITRTGRWALVTNYREGRRTHEQAPSRGSLVVRLLAETGADLATDIDTIRPELDRFNGCNLVGGLLGAGHYASNRSPRTHRLGPGVHGLSNALLDAPWPKVERVRASLARWLERADPDPDELFAALADREQAPDHALPETGVTREWERVLSSPFIVTPRYGTRCSTVLAVDRNGLARVRERSFGPDGAPTGEVSLEFRIEPPAPGAGP
jgi:uncharacterized protein with NRDE domain